MTPDPPPGPGDLAAYPFRATPRVGGSQLVTVIDLLSAWTIVAVLVAAAGLYECRVIRRERRRAAGPDDDEDPRAGVEQA